MTCDVKNKSELKIELNSLNGNWFFGGWIGIGIAIHLKKLYELELELKKFSDQLLISEKHREPAPSMAHQVIYNLNQKFNFFIYQICNQSCKF